jgi:hypothetical protein
VVRTKSASGDRRGICRYEVVIHDALLRWRQGSSFTQMPVRVVNLSLNGCLIHSPQLPGVSAPQDVWICLQTDPVQDWIEGRIISIRKPLFRKFEVRISFLTTLGFETFKRSVYGPDHWQDGDSRATPEHERDHFWK